MRKIVKEIKSFIKNRDFLYLVLSGLREYAYYLGNKLLNNYPEKKRFRRRVGYSLDLENPQSFNEKVIWKKVHDHNPLLLTTTDKYLVRLYLKDILKEKRANEILVPVLYVTDYPETIPFDDLPAEYVIKTNTGYGRNIFVVDEIPSNYENSRNRASSRNVFLRNSNLDEERVISTCKHWLKMPLFNRTAGPDWVDQNIDKKVMVEELLKDGSGEIPDDFKFYVFEGKCELIIVITDRFGEQSNTFYTPEWELLPVSRPGYPRKRIDKPIVLDDALDLAEELGKDFDFVRVDLYLIGEQIYFGELTHYPANGWVRWEPRLFDFELGEEWELS